MQTIVKKYQAIQNSQILSQINNLHISSHVKEVSCNLTKNSTGNNIIKNKPKCKTMPPCMLQKIQKITQFENLIHSKVSQVVKRTFLIELYRGVKYSLKSLKGPSQSEILQKKVNLKESLQSKRKFLLLDLDQTLIFTQKDSSIKTKSSQTAFKIHIRPYTKQFLSNISKYYEIYIFTAATKDYAQAVIQKLNSDKKIIQDFLCRDHCFETRRGKVIKDLRIIKNRSLNDIILIDNKPESFGLQIDNGIPILQFYGSKHDIELINLQKVLIQLSKLDDVRKGIKDHFKLRTLTDLTKEELQMYLKCGKSYGNSQKHIQDIPNS